MNTETNFMSFENLTKLIEEHKKETHPYKRYEFDSTSYTLLLISINNLIKENQELKKLNEEKTKIGVANHKYASQCEDKVIIMEAQQKKFIKYLEDEINKLKEQIKNYDIWHEVGTDINFLILKKQFYLEILQKHNEIIGDINDKK